jgi:imidazolonepropionase
MASIAWLGRSAEVPAGLLELVTAHHDLGGRLVLPGFIDCHTHLVYAGDRSQDFEMRVAGARYDEIARAGGGILSTVRATRAASAGALEAAVARRFARARRGAA